MSAIYETSKIDNEKYCKSNGQFTKHLKQHSYTYQSYYEEYITGISPKCRCGLSLTFYQHTHTYANSCGAPKCVGKSVSETKQNWTDEQRHADSENKSNAASKRTPEQIQEQVEKSRETFRAKYGTEWATQSDEFKDKAKKTKLDRYGNEYYSNWKASAATNGAKSSDEQNEINEKRRKTNIEKFGVGNTFLLPNISKKSGKGNSSVKDYELPSGKIIGIRGYENMVIDALLETYTEDSISVHNDYEEYVIEVFQYNSYEKNRVKKYYPDIFIPDENRIIEVKSMWWWNANGRDGYDGRIVNNLRKREAVIKQGYSYEVWLFTTKTNYQILKTKDDFEKWVI